MCVHIGARLHSFPLTIVPTTLAEESIHSVSFSTLHVRLGKLLLVLAGTVILRFESRVTHQLMLHDSGNSKTLAFSLKATGTQTNTLRYKFRLVWASSK
jgi:hypothetical protein